MIVDRKKKLKNHLSNQEGSAELVLNSGDQFSEIEIKLNRESNTTKLSRRKFMGSFFMGVISSLTTILKPSSANALIGFMMRMNTRSSNITFIDDLFSIFLYSGNGSNLSINNGINLAGKGGLVWVKHRMSSGRGHYLFDTLRGANKFLTSHLTDVSVVTLGQAFASDGFSFNNQTFGVNDSGGSFCAWTFRKSTNFFDLAITTKSPGSSKSVPFSNLGELGMVFIKRIDAAGSWYVWHRSLTAGKLLCLEQNAAETTLGQVTVSGSNVILMNGVIADGNYVIYAFAHNNLSDGAIQCGTYNGSSSIVNINLGWEAQLVLVKKIDNTSDWILEDCYRGSSETGTQLLAPNVINAEETKTYSDLCPTTTGFKVGTSNGFTNISGKFIYMAVRRPNKPPSSATKVFNAVSRTGTSAAATISGVGFAPDLVIFAERTKAGGSTNKGNPWFDRLRGHLNMKSNSSEAETAASDTMTSFDMDGFSVGNDLTYSMINKSGNTFVSWCFRRAPGFFDTILYTGTLSVSSTPHNLGVVPELLIFKPRNQMNNWVVWPAFLNSKILFLDSTQQMYNSSGSLSSSGPSQTTIPLVADSTINNSGITYVGYLFASLPGISKIGTYTGSASGFVTVPCGFSGSARFVLIKRTDAAGDWIVVDSIRGNNNYLCLNTSAAEVATTLVTFTSGGFTTAETGAITNISGASYIFLAIA